jgi:O-antigen ligase
VILVALAILAAGLAGWALIESRTAHRAVFTFATLALAPVLLLADQWDAGQVASLRDEPLVIALAVLLGGAVLIGLASAFRRWPLAFPVAAIIALPFRVPLEIGGEEANLLLPLYLVIGSGALAFLYGGLRAGGSVVDRPDPTGPAGWMRPLLAASILLYAVTIIWSSDQSQGLQNLGFFLIPFAILFVLLLEVEWNSETLRAVFVVLVVQALICAAIGFGQYATRELFWNDVVIRTNEFHVYFRVNSLFWDPNIYGRYLALVITVVAAALAWTRENRTGWLLVAVAGVLWLAMVSTFSQSSFLALLAGLAVLFAIRWSLRVVAVGGVALAVAALAFLVLAGDLVKLDLDRLNPQTGGRANLVTGGIELFGERPLAGWGAGSFSQSFRDEVSGPNAPVTESHTEPITIAAETGIIGLLLYMALLISTFAALTAGFRAVMPGLGGGSDPSDPDRGPPVARAAVFAAYVALLVHTISYAGYLDDPATWTLLAIGWGLAFRCRAT